MANAGVMATPYSATEDGFEAQFQAYSHAQTHTARPLARHEHQGDPGARRTTRLLCAPRRVRMTYDGGGLGRQVNYLSHFLLVSLLKDSLSKARARVGPAPARAAQ